MPKSSNLVRCTHIARRLSLACNSRDSHAQLFCVCGGGGSTKIHLYISFWRLASCTRDASNDGPQKQSVAGQFLHIQLALRTQGRPGGWRPVLLVIVVFVACCMFILFTVCRRKRKSFSTIRTTRVRTSASRMSASPRPSFSSLSEYSAYSAPYSCIYNK